MTASADLERFLQATFRMCRFHAHLSLELELIAPGEVRVTARYKPELDQGMGMLHGGVFAALVDASTYYTALSHYGASDRLPLTQEYKLNLLAPAKEEDVSATAKLLRAGRSVAVAEAKVHSASGKLVAVGLASMLVRGSGG